MESAKAPGLVLGDVEIIRIVEWQGPFAPVRDLFPATDAGEWREHAAELVPDHWEPASDRAVVALQSWVVRSAGRTILVDTGVGAGRERPEMPRFHHREGDLLGLLAGAGIRPEEVDIVINTHVHADHVGGNTRDADGEWVPAFPRARYLIPEADDAYFGPRNGYAGGRRADDRLIYQDSIAPVVRAGQAVRWDGSYRVDEHLALESAPGHTPGSAVLRLASGGDRAVFTGDLLHSPFQVLRPSCGSAMCVDPAGAEASRRRILARAADERELVVPAHFAGAGAVEVRRNGDGFTLERWAGYGRP